MWAEYLKTGMSAERANVLATLKHWQQDSDLAAIRDAAMLAKLPEDEQQALAQLWTEVAELRKQAEKN